MKLTKTDNPDGTITLRWDKIAGIDGYRFYSAGTFRSDTWDANRTSVKFSKGQEPYVVEAIVSTMYRVEDTGTHPAATPPPPPPPPPTFKKVAPITVTQQGASDQRVCLFDTSGNLRPGVRKLPSGEYTDESGAIYNSNGDGLENSGVRTKLPEGAFGLTKAKEMDGKSACQCHTAGDPTTNTGSWTI